MKTQELIAASQLLLLFCIALNNLHLLFKRDLDINEDKQIDKVIQILPVTYLKALGRSMHQGTFCINLLFARTIINKVCVCVCVSKCYNFIFRS